ncbi:MAG: GNAT family N-acetyltransferase [Chloroflexi bacterium]|nr:GNAT family N-acetyltransferase [Chloroflexota bacterium]MCI0575429.1 GNAT family N-acetyltransferase [Chloroflexota bacterium]MCI0649889.1 GNAT family N-acetyltransferase [Chloroflexota bacterium]MCI0725659.1 GNAT family N-acetyltransferase [Chloroflexota bacterium]
MEIRPHNVSMVRETLEGLPRYPVPPGYTIRRYRPGDAEQWYRIHLLAEKHFHVTPELFRREFGTDETLLAERQYYLLDPEGTPIGTTTAWFRDRPDGQADGLVHWVAIAPEWQGRGLAKPLLSAVLWRLHELGHRRACLDTFTLRVPAVNLYLHFGFAPDVRDDASLAAWRTLQPHLNYPVNLPETIE